MTLVGGDGLRGERGRLDRRRSRRLRGGLLGGCRGLRDRWEGVSGGCGGVVKGGVYPAVW